MKLKGHEKFSLREGWLSKGIKGVQLDNRIFTGNEGTDVLGVGSNMVKSIRYWMQSFGLVCESQKEGTKLSEFGELIEKYDFYMEDYFTLWALHSHIAKNESKSTVWYLFFNKCELEEFKKVEIQDVLKRALIAYAGTDKFPENSLKDDIDVLLSMYSKNIGDNDPEDKNKSPLAALGLLKREKDSYVKTVADERKFKKEIILYELAVLLEDKESISIDEIGKVAKNLYHLNRVALNRILDELNNYDYIKVDRTAGLDVIYSLNMSSPMQIMENYYKKK